MVYSDAQRDRWVGRLYWSFVCDISIHNSFSILLQVMYVTFQYLTVSCIIPAIGHVHVYIYISVPDSFMYTHEYDISLPDSLMYTCYRLTVKLGTI